MIFNKNNTGSLELKELIGFIYKSINFNNLKSYIGFAERDIIKIIGPEVFKTALTHYNSDNYHVNGRSMEHPEYIILDELVEKIQYPIAVHAYRRFVPSSDLTHSDKGRQIFVSEQEKPAFEWQIEKDNENLLALAHEATDVLLEFLDDHIDDEITSEAMIGEILKQELVIPWKYSEAYKAAKELLIPNVDVFEKIFMIARSRLTFLSLVPFIRRIQDNEIAACVGEDRYNEILEQFQGNVISEENKPLLDKIRQPLGLLALSVAVKRLSSQVLPSGIFTNVIPLDLKRKNPASKPDRNEVSGSLEKDGMRELIKLQEYCRKLDVTSSGEVFIITAPDEHIDPDRKYVRL